MSCEHNKSMVCQCTNDKCSHRNKCCACIANHKSKGNLPACLRPAEGDKK